MTRCPKCPHPLADHFQRMVGHCLHSECGCNGYRAEPVQTVPTALTSVVQPRRHGGTDMPHPLTSRLAAAMYQADGSPATDARGQAVTIDRYRAWADMALTGIEALAEPAPTGTYSETSVSTVLRDLAEYLDSRPIEGLEQRLHRAL